MYHSGIRNDPTSFYVNVHNGAFPGGADQGPALTSKERSRGPDVPRKSRGWARPC